MPAELLLFIGTLNRETPYFQGARGDGLSVFAFDETNLTFTARAQYPGIDNPTFLSVSPDGRYVYANSEVAEWREGLVTAFRFDRQAARLDYLNCQPALGSITAHNLISRDRKRLFVVNYTVGETGPDQSLVVCDIAPDGQLSVPRGSVAHQGHGPNPARQERAHAHSVAEMPDGSLVVADLGMDALISYRVTAEGQPKRRALSKTRPGSGPRHMALAPDGRFLFTINELDSTVTSWRWQPDDGTLQEVSTVSTLPEGYTGQSHCSDIAISPDGRFLYGANRGHDSIAWISLAPETGTLGKVAHIPCGGTTPRNLALTPSGRHLMVANQNSDRVSVFAREAGTGQLSDTGRHLAIGTPMCLKFAEVG